MRFVLALLLAVTMLVSGCCRSTVIPDNGAVQQSSPAVWQFVSQDSGSDDTVTDRIKVPGGWVLRSENKRGGLAQTFISDSLHSWNVNGPFVKF